MASFFLAKPLTNSAIGHAKVFGDATARPANKFAIGSAKSLAEKHKDVRRVGRWLIHSSPTITEFIIYFNPASPPKQPTRKREVRASRGAQSRWRILSCRRSYRESDAASYLRDLAELAPHPAAVPASVAIGISLYRGNEPLCRRIDRQPDVRKGKNHDVSGGDV